VALLVVVLVGALISFVWRVSLVWGPTVIQVSGHPTLIVESQGANQSVINPSAIHIHAGGSKGEISIRPSRPLNLPFGFPEVYQESSDQKTVIYDVDPTASGVFDITVPAETNLKIDTNGFALEVEGVTGQMVLMSNSGTLTLKNCHVSGPSLIRNNTGEIKATEDRLSGSVAFDNNTAGITFQGSLEPNGSYRFTNNEGPITLTLPQSIAVHIDATTNSGSISSTFPGTTIQKLNNGFELHADIGSIPRALLSLYNNGGSIMLNKQEGQ
jgi:hypothetical protein